MKKCLPGTLVAAAIMWACSSFNGDTPTPSSDGDAGTAEAGAVEDAPTTTEAGPSKEFCKAYTADVPICDDFELGTPKTTWMQKTNGGSLTVGDDPDPAHGKILKVVAAGEDSEAGVPGVSLTFDIDKELIKTRNGVTIDLDIRVDAPGYDYMGLVSFTIAAPPSPTILGVGKSADHLGEVLNPLVGPFVAADAAWHHVHIDATRAVQSTTIDSILITRSMNDLSDTTFAELSFGVLTGNTVQGHTPAATVSFDNVVIAPK